LGTGIHVYSVTLTASNFAAEWTTLLLCTPEVFGSELSYKADHVEEFLWLPLVPEDERRAVLQIRPLSTMLFITTYNLSKTTECFGEHINDM
jgi:hypothetical protein